MAPLTVDPKALSGAGVSVAAAGDGLASSLATLTGAINANTGYDAAGVVFGRQYVSAAGELLKAITSGANACRNIGYGIQRGGDAVHRTAQMDVHQHQLPAARGRIPQHLDGCQAVLGLFSLQALQLQQAALESGRFPNVTARRLRNASA